MRLSLLLVVLGVSSWLLASAQSGETSAMPTFGSMAAGANRLIQRESAFVPQKSLTAPGVLKGRWTSKSRGDSLIISQTYTNRAEVEERQPSVSFIEDEFTLSILPKTHGCDLHFVAAYGAFRVYGVDANGDGVEEIVLERGEGRGTFVYVQKLEILAVSNSEIVTIFEADLNGYVYNPDTSDPVSWERTYVWNKGKQTKELQLELRLIPPSTIPRQCGSEVTSFILQHPVLRFGFDHERDRFGIVEEVFVPAFTNANNRISPSTK